MMFPSLYVLADLRVPQTAAGCVPELTLGGAQGHSERHGGVGLVTGGDAPAASTDTATHPEGQPTGGSARFWNRVDMLGECWVWTGGTDRYGYGKFYVAGQHRIAHRYAYEQVIGPIPDGLTLDHTCHDSGVCQQGSECPHRRCVNPAHLAPVTPAENSKRAHAENPRTFIGRRTYTLQAECGRGHAMSGDNVRVGRNGKRVCRACEVIRRQRADAKYAAVPPEQITHGLAKSYRYLKCRCGLLPHGVPRRYRSPQEPQAPLT